MIAIAPAWRSPLVQLGVLVALLLAAQWPAASSMAELWWHSDTFAHGMLVLPISAWLVWCLRGELAALAPQAWAPGLLLLVPAVLVGAAGSLAQVNVLQHFAVIVSLQALVLTLLGPAVARAIAFPLGFLLFAPPFGEFMTEPMMAWTADFVVYTLRLTGVPVFREGMNFVIPSGAWSVVEACSGVRYLMASFMVGTLFAYLNFTRWRRRVAFMAVSLLMPILANWVRAYLIVMIGHLSNNELATGVDHLVYGWLFFGLVMLLMFWIGGRFADAPPAGAAAATALPAAVAPLRWLLVLTAAAVVLLPALAVQRLQHPPAVVEVPLALALPELQLQSPLPWQPRFSGADAQLQQSWRVGDQPVQLDLGAWRQQRDGAKAVSSSNVLAPSTDARWLRAGGSDAEQRWLLRTGGGESQPYLLRRFWWVDGRFTSSPREAKWWGLRQLLAGRGDAAAMLVLLTPEEAGGERRLDATWQRLQAPLNERLRAWAGQGGLQNLAAQP